MKSCSDIRDRFFDLLTGKLKAEEARRVRRHLEDCEACRAAFEKFVWIHTQLVKDPSLLDSLAQEGCPAAETLVDFSEGRLEGEEAQKIQRHLAVCDTCRGTVEALSSLALPDEGFTPRKTGEAEPPLPFIQAVRAAYPLAAAPKGKKRQSLFNLNSRIIVTRQEG